MSVCENFESAATVLNEGPKMKPLNHHPGNEHEKKQRAEIDTSAPFESVKEAATRFGGFGFWKPNFHKHHFALANAASSENDSELFDIAKLEEEAAQLERDLTIKEKETFDVLKELENTKLIVEELKSKVQKAAANVDAAVVSNSLDLVHSVTQVAEDQSNPINKLTEKESHPSNEVTREESDWDSNLSSNHPEMAVGSDLHPSPAPGFILLELKQAKLNLARTTSDLADIRTSVESYKHKIEKERISMEKTRQRLSSNASKVSSLEKELNETRLKLQVVSDAKSHLSSDDPMAIHIELQKLSSETEEFRKIGDLARSEILKAMSEIEQTKAKLKTAEIRLVAARKMKEAARASETVALAEIEAILNSENLSQETPEGITLTFEEYSSLIKKAREAEEASKIRVVNAMLQIDEADVSKMEILKKVEEATEEVKTSKKALEEALSRVDAANRGKLAVEEAMRKWRSERSQRRRSVHNVAKFKNPGITHHRKDPALLDVNGLNLVNDEPKPSLKSTLSIGQILSRKLLLAEEYENGMQDGKQKVSLGQMLGKSNGELQSVDKDDKENNHKQLKRKKFGFAKISFLVTKQSKKKKKQTASSRCRSM